MSPSGRTLLPVKDRLESFWLDKRDPALCNLRTSTELPPSVDVAIIGSGLSGAMISYLMYEKAKEQGLRPPNVVMLEADETCGSATARNGGHCKPLTFLGYNRLKAKHGKEVANSILELEEAALETYSRIVEKEKIDCDLQVTRSFDVFFDKDDAERGKQDLYARKHDWPKRCGDAQAVDSPASLEKIAGVKGAVWSAHYPAGHLWPYLLATSLIRVGLRQGMNLQTYTGVTAIVDGPKGPIVKTTCGDISASLVIAASNAYTASFLPEFASKIVPVRGTVSAIRPPVSHRPGGHPGPLGYTYGFRHGVGDTDYLIPRHGHVTNGKGDTSIILGGAKSRFLKNHELWYDNIDDNEEMPGARQYFEEFMPKTFLGWDGGADNVEKVWTGVLGYSNDFSPFVGLHPERKGIMVCAGFTGHGMPQIPACTDALAGLAISFLRDGGKVSPTSKAAFDSTLPHTFRLTKERYESTVNVIKEYMGQGGDASGAIDTTDEAAMLARSKL